MRAVRASQFAIRRMLGVCAVRAAAKLEQHFKGFFVFFGVDAVGYRPLKKLS